MANTKQVELVAAPPATHFVGDGFKVHNFIPSLYRLDMERMDPFLMLDYNSPFYFAPTNEPRGVGVHPHRGFETVTIAYKGKVAHEDSRGNKGVVAEGDVQWMTAASGILHKEYHEENFSKTGGDFQMVQLWVNLPAKDKMSTPKYQAIAHKDINKYQLPNDAGVIEVIAGEYNGVAGAANTFKPVHLYNIRLRKGATVSFDLPENYPTALLMIEGAMKVNNNEVVEEHNLALMQNEGTTFGIDAIEDCIVLRLSGKPIGEAIAAQSPFVMNTRSELVQAYQDYNNGAYGC